MTRPEVRAALGAQRLPIPVFLFAAASLLNEISAQMVAPLIPILIGSNLAAGPVALGAIEGVADAVAAFIKLWSGRHADVRPASRKWMVLLGYGVALASRPLIGLAGHWLVVAALRSADRLGKGLRGAPRDAILADATTRSQRGRAYGLNRGMDYAGAVVGTLIAAAALAWWDMSVPQVILLSVLPGAAVLLLLALLPNPAAPQHVESSRGIANAPLQWGRLAPELRAYLKVLALFCFARTSEAFILLRGHELGLSTVTLLLQLFERFVRGDAVQSGSGLGLAIVKRICEHLEWNVVWAERPDGGSRFELQFHPEADSA